MTIYVPGWMQGGSYSAAHDRINSKAAMFDEGVETRIALKVTQRGAGANMTVDVAAGACVVQGDDSALQGNYDVFNDAVVNLTGFVATSANTRYDLVVMQINDPTAGGAAGNNAVITRVAGTQAASPVIPAIPNSALLLAVVGPFTTSTSSITNAMVHDCWTGTGPTGVAGARLLQGLRDAPGTVKETFNAIAPNGWLIGAGQNVSRTTYATLFEHFGTTFGVGDGSTTFGLPDLRGRVLVALDNQGGSDAGRLAAANTLGGSGGAETHTLSTTEIPSHVHNVDPPNTVVAITDPGHIHNQQADMAGGAGHTGMDGGPATFGGLTGPHADSGVDTQSAVTGISAAVNIAAFDSAAAGSGSAHNNLQPYILCYGIVRT